MSSLLAIFLVQSITRVVVQSQGRATQNGDTSALDKLQQQAKETTDAAVAEGRQSVEAAKSASAGYLEQAKSLAENALATAQVRYGFP